MLMIITVISPHELNGDLKEKIGIVNYCINITGKLM